jgi:hypothetical protein
MSTTNRAGLRAGILGLILGCIPAVWLVGWVAAAPAPTAPNAAPPVPAADKPATGVAAAPAGGQLGQMAVSPAVLELRKLFPLKSVVKRLDYEKAGLQAFAKEEPAPRLTEETQKRLTVLENKMELKRQSGRSQSLLQLYSNPIPRLVNTPAGGFGGIQGGFGGGMFGMGGGFGGGMFGMGGFGGSSVGQFGQAGAAPLTRKDLELPLAPQLSFAALRYADSGNLSSKASAAPGPNMLAGLQESGLLDFLDPAGFGYVEDREHVAGFEPHQFRATPELAGVNERWVVIRLELVSMLKHKEPVAYATDAFPNLTESDNAPTRPLNLIEKKALKALREGDDLATETSGDRIRIVGSLRASKQCLECHEVKRGDLLGAFSWELQRQPADEKNQRVLP